MNFSEIKQFKVRFSGQPIDQPLSYLSKTIAEWEDDGLEINPDFQRGHVWNENQQTAYIEFIARGGSTAPLIINVNPHSGQPTYLLDGLQRLTALKKFLKNEIKAFGQILHEFSDHKIFLRRTSIKIQKVYFDNRRDLLTAYIELNNGGVVHAEEELNRVRELLKKEAAQG